MHSRWQRLRYKLSALTVVLRRIYAPVNCWRQGLPDMTEMFRIWFINGQTIWAPTCMYTILTTCMVLTILMVKLKLARMMSFRVKALPGLLFMALTWEMMTLLVLSKSKYMKRLEILTISCVKIRIPEVENSTGVFGATFTQASFIPAFRMILKRSPLVFLKVIPDN